MGNRNELTTTIVNGDGKFPPEYNNSKNRLEISPKELLLEEGMFVSYNVPEANPTLIKALKAAKNKGIKDISNKDLINLIGSER